MTHRTVRHALRVALTLSLTALAVATPTSASADDAAPLGFDDVELPLGAPPAVTDSIDRSVQWRSIDLDVDALRAELASDSVEIELFDDADLVLGTGTLAASAGDGFVWSATAGLDSAILTIDGDTVHGSVLLDGRSFSITPVGDAHVLVEEGDVDADVGEPLPLPDDLSALPTGDAVSAARQLIANGDVERAARTAEADGDGNRIVRVLTVYTNGARSNYGNNDATAVAALGSVIDDANVVLANSQITARLESAGIRHVDYDDAGLIDDDLNALTLAETEALFDVHVERELVDADIVMMVRGVAGNTCGLAWLLEQPSSALDDEFAMGVIDTVCAPANQRGFIHEVGHILGAGHGNVAGDGVFSYSAGYNSGTYRTIMAYANGCGCDRIPFFSAPRTVNDTTHGMVSIGSASQDNSRTLNETAGVVANFRPFPLMPTLPGRLLDTRPGEPTFDDYEDDGRRTARSVTTLPVAGRGEVPADAEAVMLNVTAVRPDAPGHVTVWPCDAEQPTASNLNYAANRVVPNSVLAKLDASGQVCIYTHAAGHLIADVTAYIPAGGTLQPLVPARYLETRSGQANETFDGTFEGDGARGAGTTLQLQITGRGGVADGTEAVMLNVTAVQPQAAGHITVYPCDAARPTASSLNYTPGTAVANAVLSKLDAQGRVCLYTFATTHVVVDVTGAIESDSRILTVTPARLLETRSGNGLTTVDGIAQGTGIFGPDASDQLPVVLRTSNGFAGRGGVTPGAWASIVNVTVVRPDRPGHITVWPCTEEIPTASNLNYVPGQVVANMAIAEFGYSDNGDGPCIYTLGATHLLVDVVAYF